MFDTAKIQGKDPVPPEIVKAADTYYRFGVMVQLGMVLLGAIAFVASLAIATFGDGLNARAPWMLKAIAFVAALSAGLLTTFSIAKKNRDIWAAWRMMNGAILRYRYDPAFKVVQLIDVWEKAETTLGNASIAEKA
jgi:hypothetical protein